MKLSKGWFVAYVKGNCEFRIALDVKEAGFLRATFVPKRTVMRKPRHVRHGRAEPIPVVSPLYVRYVFFRAGDDKLTSFILRHRDVVGVVRGATGEYARMREREVRRLRALVREGVFDEVVEKEEAVVEVTEVSKKIELKEGSLVSIIDGPFRGMEARFTKARGSRALIVVTGEGKELELEISAEKLRSL